MTGALLTLVLAAVAAGALAQAASGMGFSLVAAPALVLALGPREGVAVTLVLAALSSVVPLARDHRHVRPRAVLPLLVPALALTPVLAWVLRGVDTRWLALGSGLGVLAGVGLLAGGVRSTWFRRRRAAVASGGASALLNLVGGVGGPPVGIYAANADWGPAQTRANLHAFFLVQNLVTAAVLGPRVPSLPELVALGAGTGAGMVLAGRMSAAAVRHVVLAVSFVGGVGLTVGAL
ncbi:TSUP family transporter [Aeromicrobium massiliense]|uniref:TSUP family transporter n=1 Tax=Aeromicrobium massiliense TaxID=1464554 RepID=UPI0005784D8F|nr:TSUP family transporter [Aeromicrobium massiliense]